MLKSLSEFDKREAEGILSSVTLSLLPKPTSEPQHEIDEYLYRRILDESKEQLSIDPDDETAAARSRVVDFLGNQISESVLYGADVSGIEARLHQSDVYRTAPAAMTDMASAGGDQAPQIIEEELAVGKRQVQRSGARVHTVVTEQPVSEQVTLHEEKVVVERRPVDRPFTGTDAAAESTFEATETTEVPVVAKAARVVEEVVVGRTATDRAETIVNAVRRTGVEVEEAPGATVNGTAKL